MPRPTQAVVEPDQISLERTSEGEEMMSSQLSFTGHSQKGYVRALSNSSSTVLNEIE